MLLHQVTIQCSLLLFDTVLGYLASTVHSFLIMLEDNKKLIINEKDWYNEDSWIFISATPGSFLSKHY